jgi:hypothetical protein
MSAAAASNQLRQDAANPSLFFKEALVRVIGLNEEQIKKLSRQGVKSANDLCFRTEDELMEILPCTGENALVFTVKQRLIVFHRWVVKGTKVVNPRNFTEDVCRKLQLQYTVERNRTSPIKRVKLGESLPIVEIDVAQLRVTGILDIGGWSVGSFQSIPVIGDFETDFPESLYVRQEMLDIFHVFTKQIECQKELVFVGTTGVGKSVHVVLFSFYMAIKLNMRVQLLRRTERGYSLLNLDGRLNRYWKRIYVISFLDLDFQFTLCLDGFQLKEIVDNHGILARFTLLATSTQYKMSQAAYSIRDRCLVPFWSFLDLKAIGTAT